MTLGQALRLSVQRPELLACGVILGAMLGLLYAKISSPIYASTAEIILSVQTPQNITSSSLADQLSPAYLFTQIDILESDQVAINAAVALGLVNKADTSATAPSAVREAALHTARALRLNMRVEAGAGFSRVIDIKYSSVNATFAADAANKFAEAFQAVRLNLQAEPAQVAAIFYDSQVEKQAQQLRTAQTLLIARQRDLGIAATDAESAEPEVARLQALGGELAGADRRSADAAARQGSFPATTLNNGAVQGLEVQIAQARAQREQLLANAGSRNPRVLELSAQIGALEAAQRRAQSQLAVAAGQSAAIESASVRNLSQTMANQKGRAIAERSQAAELNRQQRDVNTRQQLYDQVIARRAQFQLAGTSEHTDVAILSPALPPSVPVWPNAKISVMAVGILGGVLAALISLFAQILGQRVRKTRDLEQWLGLEALAEIRLADRGAQPPQAQKTERSNDEGDNPVSPSGGQLPVMIDLADGMVGVLDAPHRQYTSPVGEELFAWHQPTSIAADDLRNLRTALLMPSKRGPETAAVIAFVSTADDEGRAALVSNLAILLASAGIRTMLIDGDVSRTVIGDMFGVAEAAGLSDYLAVPDARAQSTVFADLPHLTIITSGTAPPLNDDTLAGEKLAVLLADAAQHSDFILINTPAAIAWSGYLLIARQAGAAIFVTLKKVTRVREAAMILNTLEEAGIRVLGGLCVSRPGGSWRERLRIATLLALPKRMVRRRAEVVNV